MPPTVENTYGALLLGAFLACCLSGIVTVQAFLYIKLYPKDSTRTKFMVGVVWLLDTLHTGFVMATIWNYIIAHFSVLRFDFIPWTAALSIAVTAILTIIVHLFLAWRIHRMTDRDWRITFPILVLAVLRLAAASGTTSEMLILKSFTEFAKHFRWLFTLGLALSSIVDVLITVTLCYKLRSSRTGSSAGMDTIIDSLVLYTFETGTLTCAGTILSMICWLTMPSNRLFLALHFMIAKLYANSLLATLNARRQLSESRIQTTRSGNHVLPVMFPEFSSGSRRKHGKNSSGSDYSENTVNVADTLQINVRKTVDTKLDEEDSAMPDFVRPDPSYKV